MNIATIVLDDRGSQIDYKLKNGKEFIFRPSGSELLRKSNEKEFWEKDRKEGIEDLEALFPSEDIQEELSFTYFENVGWFNNLIEEGNILHNNPLNLKYNDEEKASLGFHYFRSEMLVRKSYLKSTMPFILEYTPFDKNAYLDAELIKDILPSEENMRSYLNFRYNNPKHEAYLQMDCSAGSLEITASTDDINGFMISYSKIRSDACTVDKNNGRLIDSINDAVKKLNDLIQNGKANYTPSANKINRIYRFFDVSHISLPCNA